jgi:type I restriction enzyme M protein
VPRRSKQQPTKSIKSTEQTELKFPAPEDEKLEVSAMETWLWDAACTIRGTTDAPKFKDFILPLVFYKRLSDVFDDEFARHVEEFGDEETAHEVIEADHKDAIATGRKDRMVRYYIPDEYRWDKIRNHGEEGLGEFITTATRKVTELNPELKGVLDIKDYNETQSGQRTLGDDRLAALVEVVSRHRLGLKNTSPDVFGDAYEYLLRKFAEGQGQSAGEFLTPPEVGWLMAEIIDPAPYTTIYDPTCGSARLLIKPRLVFERNYPDQKSKAPKLYGQELNHTTFAIAKMNAVIYDFRDSSLEIGDTFLNPKFVETGKGLMRHDYAVANPMWNQSNYDTDFYEKDHWKRFEYGTPSKSSADWGWVQHILASLNDQGRAGIVLDTGAVSRGSGSKSSNKERDIRSKFVERDLIEGVILLPENLFYNTTAPGIILLLNRHKSENRQGEILLVNASAYCVKVGAKNRLTDVGIKAVAEVYRNWETREKLSRVVTKKEVQEADYNLSPSQFVEVNDKVTHRPISEILMDLEVARSEREKADKDLAEVLAKLNLNGMG